MAEEFELPAAERAAERERIRYLAFQVISELPVNYVDVSTAIWYSVLNFLGETGTATAQLRIIKDAWNAEKQVGLLRVMHSAVESARVAAALVTRIGDIQVIIKVLGVSGSLAGARKKFFGEADLESYVGAE
jgi:ribonuclease P/MRP protein subunit POP5